ncbi:futalosine nucleosidase [Solidesulfovibrio carbinoliphilus subsp. oakridgensis]|uniref:Futalosine hydrolase n=1 Tax=Solidesulfovibrio carbinoliphilus subsp. oakridgensis TaxID=694327 RepID=G7Q9X4_9BACT|nr:futalosine hydrolase [Solidesulfovibrio carbinoliphilus]EHJ47804.1 futalosine nucleosidase [Solidesulfovibrio carbinoliphilus subsp. oakridgensis]
MGQPTPSLPVPETGHGLGPGGTSGRGTPPSGRRRLLVACATAKEYKAALAPLGAPAAPEPGRAVPWRRGGRDFLILVTGVGPVAAALAVGRVLGRHEGAIGGLVNCGVAGSFDLAGVPLGGLVAATAEAFPEFGLRREAGTDPRGIGFPQLSLPGAGGGPVFDRLPLAPEAAAGDMGLSLPPGTLFGPCVTVAGVSGDAARAALLARRYGAACESMEGFAVGLAAAVAGLPFLELRTVSNRVGARPPEDWDLAGALAALGRAVAILFS